MEANYAYQRSMSRVHSFNPVTPTSTTSVTLGTESPGGPSQLANAAAADYPEDTFNLQRVSVLLRYWLLKNLTVRRGGDPCGVRT